MSIIEEDLVEMYKKGSFAGQKMLIKIMKELLIKVPTLTTKQLLEITEKTISEREFINQPKQ